MMKKEEAMVMESSNSRSPNGALFYSDSAGGGYSNQCSVFDDGLMGNGVGSGELGFLEMLGVPEFQIPMGSSYMFEDMFQREVLLPDRSTTDHHHHYHQVAASGEDGMSNNAPGTPNSSSISSASNNEGVVVESEQEKVEEDDEEEDEEEGSGKSKKQLKAKKGNLKKKQRQPRFAFMTKSEVDHLEDGYRWRKYGQKAVKNSPFPRSYYRCTTASCGVKKRVERSCTDKSIVVTTYEGQHTHPSPLTPRGLSSAIFRDSAAFAATMQMNNLHYSRYPQQHLLTSSSSSYFASSPLNYNSYPSTTSLTTAHPNFTSFTASPTNNANVSNPNQGFIRDHGLLQDLIPSLVPKMEYSNNTQAS